MASPAARAQRQTVDLSGKGWQLWRDTDAQWENDQLFPPGTGLDKIPTNPPTGGWEALDLPKATPVSVPGTVEEYLYKWDSANPDNKLSQGIKGVSWWYRTFTAPKDLTGKHVTLEFDSARFRAEVYLDHKLVAYNLVDGVPFSADITGLLKPGENAQLAVRITSPGGIWSWEDFKVIRWGTYIVPMSHGFSGVTGPVTLSVTQSVHIDDLYVQNTPDPHVVNALVTLENSGTTTTHLELEAVVSGNGLAMASYAALGDLAIPPGESTQTLKISAPKAKLWDLDHPNLYTCMAYLSEPTAMNMNAVKRVDALGKQFGFRWFAPEGIGSDAMLKLNGKRVVLRTAISWGLWPNNGLFPTEDLAVKQVADAKAFGMNMLNFHRCIGSPVVLNAADRMGLLYFEEPGNYQTATFDPFCAALMREKLLRMVKRDRSHPSLIIYNMINEWNADLKRKPEIFDTFKADMAAAHALDPSRQIVIASAWARKPAGSEEPVKLNMRPFDTTQYLSGWWDFHRAGGPVVWNQAFYISPDEHYGLTKNKGEIVYWGEEGAVSTPPRLALIKKEVEASPTKGWDGDVYLDWYKQFDNYMTEKKLFTAFPTLDDFTKALGAVSLEHQGRKIEDIRICDLNDGYAINGWEAEPYEDHSGIVDCYRNPKADPAILAYYNQPLYVAVKSRNLVLPVGGSATVDFYLINEKNLTGAQTLNIAAVRPDGTKGFEKSLQVSATGGEVYGQLLTEGISVPFDSHPGMWTIQAALTNAAGKQTAIGHEQILAVDWKSAHLGGKGAVYEDGTTVRGFLKDQMGQDVPAYSGTMGHLDWVLVARSSFAAPEVITPDFVKTPDGSQAGFKATVYHGRDFSGPSTSHVDPQVDANWPEGSNPDPSIEPGTEFGVAWEGNLMPPATGEYLFNTKPINGTVTLLVNGHEIVGSTPVALTAGQPAKVEVKYWSKGGHCGVSLLWSRPTQRGEDPDELVSRAKDGTTVIIADYADSWMSAVQKATNVKYKGPFTLGTAWTGGQYFAVKHPLFAGLPVNQALNWPYEDVVRTGRSRYGLVLDGEQLVAGCWQSTPMQLGTAVGVIPSGKGKIVVSTLDICPHLDDAPGPADVARKLFCNYIQYGMPNLKIEVQRVPVKIIVDKSIE
jgi:beta-galactosidase